MWILSRLLRLMVGKKVPYENAYWQHFIEVLEILDYTLRPIVRQHTPDNLAAVIGSNLYDFKLLYPTSPFLPKMHYMTHIPRYLKKYVT